MTVNIIWKIICSHLPYKWSHWPSPLPVSAVWLTLHSVTKFVKKYKFIPELAVTYDTDFSKVFQLAESHDIIGHSKGQMLQWLRPKNSQSTFWKLYLILIYSRSPASTIKTFDCDLHCYYFYGDKASRFIVPQHN